MKHNQKLELTWIGKENQPRLEPRRLIENKLEFQKRMHGMRLTESGSSLSARWDENYLALFSFKWRLK